MRRILVLSFLVACSSNGSNPGDGGGGGDGTVSMNGEGGTTDGGGSGDGGPGACLGSALLASLGKTHLLAGASMTDQTAAAAPFELRYTYLSGGLFDGTSPCASCASNCTADGVSCKNGGPGCGWWGCWQYDQDPPGAYVRGFADTCAKNGQIPMITYYEILHTSKVQEGAAEITQAATNTGVMTRYFADWRFLLQQIGMRKALLHIEPDFWGYAEQLGPDPHKEMAAVATANPTDCAMMENSIAGMGACMIAMVRKYAPNARVGLQASAWSTNIDVAMNTDPKLDVAGEAKKTANFLAAAGADADFIVVEASDRDAGYYQSIGRQAWWDDTNTKLPTFHQAFGWAKTVAETANKPLVWWQLPVGNMMLPNTNNAWKDNRVDYFFAHTQELADAHSIGFAFGAGAGGQTTPESDGGNLIAKVKAYAGATQMLCK